MKKSAELEGLQISSKVNEFWISYLKDLENALILPRLVEFLCFEREKRIKLQRNQKSRPKRTKEQSTVFACKHCRHFVAISNRDPQCTVKIFKIFRIFAQKTFFSQK